MDIKTLSIKLEPLTNRKVINGKYRIIKKIGQGQFGKVLLGEIVDGAGLSNGDDRSTKDAYGKTEPEDNLVAIKTINRIDKTRLITKAYLSQTTKIKREIKIMKECNHPNVVKLYQVIDDLKFDKILLILEYCKFGEVDWKRYSHYYEKYKNTDREALTMNKILRDVVNGLEYLHSIKKIIHRDLKPSNLLIAADNSIKISDFGVSLILENNADDEKELGKVMGTPAFYAPELCQFVHNRFSVINNEHHAQNMVKIDHRIDIWSLGVIMYCLIFNNLPFNGRNEFELFKHIVKEELTFPKIKVSSKVTDSDLAEMKLLKDLIRRMLSKDPETRISITEIKMHGFTTFDLDDKGKDEFWAVNSQFFKDKSKSDKAIKASQEKAEAEERRIQKAASDKAAEADLLSKIRRFFGKSRRPDKLVLTKETILLPPNPLKSPVKSINSIESPKDIHNLEPVDDLLDSYLDDSLSMGSIEGEFVDTSNILSGLEEEISTEKLLNLFADTPTTESIKIPIMKTNSQSLLMTGSSSAPISGFSSIPPNKLVTPVASRFPLNIHVNSALSSSTNTSPMSMTINTYVLPQTPTNSHIVTVGDTSPSGSLKSIFSPTQRFFFRNKEKKPQEKAKATAKEKPTINSLSSPAKKVKKMDFEATRKKYTDLMEPPPIFGLNAAYPSKDNNNNNNNNSNNSRDSNSTGLGSLQASPISDTGTFGGGPSGGTALSSGTPSPATDRRVEFSSSGPSRTNSVISVGSGSGNTIGYGLSRITSSSSSLNLNAYLTDDNFLFVSTRSMKNGSKYLNDDTDDDFDFRAGNQEEEDEEDEGEADETLTVEDPADRPVPHGTYEVPANRFHSMSDFLDGLDT